MKVVSVDRSLLMGVAPGFSADFTHPMSCERPIKFLRHLVRAMGINRIIAMSDINVHSVVIILLWKWTRTRTKTRTWNWRAFSKDGAIVPIAPYRWPMPYQDANSYGAMFSCLFLKKTKTCRLSKFRTAIETALQTICQRNFEINIIWGWRQCRCQKYVQ